MNMASTEQIVGVYQELAEAYNRRGEAQMRDRFLVLAADAAFSGRRKDDAERLRVQLLQQNPHHLLKPYASFAEAMKSKDVQNYVTALRRSHPYERAELMLENFQREAADGQGSGAKEGSGNRLPDAGDGAAVYRVEGADMAELDRLRSRARPSNVPVLRGSTGPADTPRNMDIYPVRRDPDMPPSLPRIPLAPTVEGDMSGGWVALGLFCLALIASVSLALHTLLRPFLPQE
jgi:hypothetical protein